MISRLLSALLLAAAAVSAAAADMPFGLLDITLGTSFARLERDLDFRDIDTALAKNQSGKPDFGLRGYGCMPRDDDFADTACVSHSERLDGIETREIRLHFLEGRLQQFSLTAEVQQYDAVIGYLRARYGAPRALPVANAGGVPTVQWDSEAARIDAHHGKDLVFVNFELKSYPDAMKRKREGKRLQCE
jgi:hypothetical protein